MGKDRDPDSFERRSINFPPHIIEAVRFAANLHGTTFNQELMDAAERNLKLAKIEQAGGYFLEIDGEGMIQGDLLDGRGEDMFNESDDPEPDPELPPNVVPLHQDSW